MQYRVFSILLWCVLVTTYAQEEISRFDHYNPNNWPVNSGFSMTHPEKDEFMVYLTDDRYMHLYFLDSLQRVFRKIQVEKTRRAYDEPIGKLVSKEGYTFYFHDRKEKRVASLTFDPKVGQITRYGEYEVPLKLAEIITSFPYNDHMMMLVLQKKEGVLALYELGDAVVRSTLINPEALGIVDAAGKALSLRRELRENAIEAVAIQERKLSPGVRKNTERFKIFRFDDQLQWLIDISPEQSQLVTVSLETFKISTVSYPKPKLANEKQLASQSTLYKNLLGQAFFGKNKVAIKVIDLETETVLEASEWDEFEAEKFDSYTKKGVAMKYPALMKRVWFERIADHPQAIAFKDTPNGIVLEVGSWKKPQDTHVDPMLQTLYLFGAVGGLIAMSINNHTNPGLINLGTHFAGTSYVLEVPIEWEGHETKEFDPSSVLYKITDILDEVKGTQLLSLEERPEGYLLGIWDPEVEVISLRFISFD
ncbi:hypothetical protein [Altibacter sp. HG106]|uniref:hypothetical protein n=1 Tax=Altibacter sp. HG106 TaxID=3023937 RepID=UPI002350BE9F|nr:hypothetical protein [Altibacter sp. HG106]MDC7994824.1 hypothetical protein [Altibacter sp. HG106]